MLDLPSHCNALLTAKASSGMTFAAIAEALGKPEVWTTALFFGQARCDKATAEAIVKLFGNEQFTAEKEVVLGLCGESPATLGMLVRGDTWDGPPKDPVLYRLYEVLVVYGTSYKALIQEKFGDGIMSAIDFRTSLVKKPDPKGDRVVITLDGKFLPYSTPEFWSQ